MIFIVNYRFGKQRSTTVTAGTRKDVDQRWRHVWRRSM